MKVTVELINREIAEQFLKTNIQNRPMQRVGFYTDQMLNGHWLESGDTIRFSKSGRLIDGQNRLHAIIKSNTEHRMIVVRDLEEDVFHVIDTGKIRSAKDVLVINGLSINSSKLISPIAASVLKYRENKFSEMAQRNNSKQFISGKTNYDILVFVNDNPNLEFIAKEGLKNYYRFKLIKPSVYGTLIFILSEIDMSLCDLFMHKLTTGIDLKENDPILLLRNKIIKANSENLKFNHRVFLALIFITWNAFRKGVTLKRVEYDPKSMFPLPI
jgi:hypothetical protein